MNETFKPILAAAGLMRGFAGTWFVAGGWAIDLFLNRVTRKHSDIEIGIYRDEQQLLWDQLEGWSFKKAMPGDQGSQWVAWEKGEELRLPVHQIRAGRSEGEPREVEFLLHEREAANWCTRRHPGLTRAVSEVAIECALGIPILAPEIQLLFKAKKTRKKDHDDFQATLPRLNGRQRTWLAMALRQYHADHEWIAAIDRQAE
jgi:hypothetical protein